MMFCYLHHYRNVVIAKASVLNAEKVQILHMKICSLVGLAMMPSQICVMKVVCKVETAVRKKKKHPSSHLLHLLYCFCVSRELS